MIEKVFEPWYYSRMPEISIIVPFYNVEQYLRECLDSIVSQTFSDFEVILIDDGSADSSGSIADAYAEKDKRFRVFHQENRGGVTESRNRGIQESKSPYIMFVDSDDYVDPHYCEVPYEIMKQNNVDFVSFEINYVGGPAPRPIEGKERILNRNEGYVALAADEITSSSCDKLFRRKVLDNIKYAAGKVYEDVGLAYSLIKQSERIYISKKILYTYRKRPNSITTSISEKRRLDEIEMHTLQVCQLIRVFSQPEKEFECPVVLNHALSYMVSVTKQENNEIDRMADGIIHRLKGLGSSLSKKKQMLLFLYLHANPLFHFVCKLWGTR